MRIINRNDSKLSYMEIKKKEDVIEFLKNEDGYCLGQMKKKYNEEADYEDYEYVKGLIA